MNWGHKLMLVFILFAAGIIYLVWRSMSIETELVSKEYYKDELRYQQVIDGSNLANQLSGVVTISQQDDFILMKMPAEMKNGAVSGTIWFYCAADEKNDRRVAIRLNPDAIQQIDSKKFKPGNYTVKIDWMNDSKHYYAEQPLTVL